MNSGQLVDWYVHYHFIQFTRLYHALSTAVNNAALAYCRGHLSVLLAMCQNSESDDLRRRFLQLHIVDFLVREISLENDVHYGKVSEACEYNEFPSSQGPSINHSATETQSSSGSTKKQQSTSSSNSTKLCMASWFLP